MLTIAQILALLNQSRDKAEKLLDELALKSPDLAPYFQSIKGFLAPLWGRDNILQKGPEAFTQAFNLFQSGKGPVGKIHPGMTA